MSLLFLVIISPPIFRLHFNYKELNERSLLYNYNKNIREDDKNGNYKYNCLNNRNCISNNNH